MTTVAVLGLGRMGAAVAARLAPVHDVRTWTRGDGGSPESAVAGARVVLLCLYDASACRDVLTSIRAALADGVTVVNTSTIGPDEAVSLEALVTVTRATYLHAPVMGSTPAVQGGQLTILAGRKPGPDTAAVLDTLGETLVIGSSAEAAALKLVANGVLGDSVASLRRTLARGDALGLSRDAVLDVVGRTVLGRFVDGRRGVLDGTGARPAATFTAGALAKDLALLARAAHSVPEAAIALDVLVATGCAAPEDDIAVIGAATPDPTGLADARLDVSPEVVADPAALEPLHAYARTHATGDPAYLADAFLPTAHIEGYRDGAFVSWDLPAFADVFTGSPAADEATRWRRVERLDVRGNVATAVMTLHHGDVDFTDVFVLLRDPDLGWRIANKAYERRMS